MDSYRINNNDAHAWRFKFVMSTVACCFIAACGMYGYYLYAKNSTTRQFQGWLVGQLHDRIARIDDLLKAQIKHEEYIVRDPYIATVIEALSNNDKKNDEQYHEDIQKFFSENSSNYNYNNRILIDLDGRVVFSNVSPAYKDVRVVENFKGVSALGDSFMRVIMTSTLDISDYLYDPILKIPALYISMPIFKNKAIIGVMACQVSNDAITNIMHEYIGLGSTGDIVFGNANYYGVNGLIYISNSRIEQTKAFKSFYSYREILHSSNPLGIASFGHAGAGEIEQGGVATISAWDYIPKVDWGVAARKNVAEVEHPYNKFFIFAALLLLLGVVLLLYGIYINPIWHQALWTAISKNWVLPFILKIACGLLVLILCSKIYVFVHTYHAGFQNIEQKAKEAVISGKEELNRLLDEAQSIGSSLAYHLSTGYLKKDDIPARVTRDLKQFSFVHGITIAWEPYQYAADKRLYALYMYKKDKKISTQQLADVYDYTTEGEKVGNVLDPANWAWYTGAIKKHGLLWFDPYIESEIDSMLVGYSIPFFAVGDPQKALGVVNVVINLANIKHVVQSLEISNDGYPILLSSTGAFIYHPVERHILESDTVYNLAEEEGSGELLNVAHDILAGKEGLYCYYSPATGETMRLYAQMVGVNKWIISGIFPATEGALPNIAIRQYCITIMLTILLLCLLVSFLYFLSAASISSVRISVIVTIILALALLGILTLVRFTPTFDQNQGTVLIDQNRVTRFLQERNLYAQNINEPQTIGIPTGIQIYSITFPTSTTLRMAGYVWQRYGKDIDTSLIREVFFEGVEITHLSKLYETKEGDETIIGWEFNAVVEQKFHYTQYPFDSITLEISLEYPNLEKPFLLIPSLVDYRTIRPKAIPGISQDFTLSGYEMNKSFFAFAMYPHDVTFGLALYKNVPESPYLAYRINLQRNLLYDFIIFFLPVLIIFFILYGIFTIQMQQKIQGLYALSAYTGLIFAVTLLHRSLRDRFITGDILYLEYLFFMIYLVFGVLALYTLLESNVWIADKKIFEWYRIFFWPIQLLVLLIITVLVFYHT